MNDKVRMIHMPVCPKATNPKADCDCNPRQIFPESAVNRTLRKLLRP